MAAIDKRIAALDPAFKNCRRFRHFYEEEGVYRHTEEGSQYLVIVKVCQTCTHEVHDYFNLKLEYEFSRPYYPDGYLLHYTEKEKEEGLRLGPRSIAVYELRQMKRSDLPQLRADGRVRKG